MKAARQYPWLAAGLVLAAGAAAWAFWPSSADAPPPDHAAGPAVDPEPPPPDPRLTFDTPFRNVKPDVRYLGDAACSGCHADIDKSYHQHPMGRSAAVVGDGPAVEKYDPDARNPFAVHGYTLRADRTPGGVVHRVSAARPDGEPLPDYAVTADVAIGSGARGRSYLTVDRGAVWQSPLSWYGHEGRWDLSPGYDLGGNGGRRAVVPECLFCHVDRVDPVPGSRNRYRDPLLPGQAAIGCERCHGPGELHAAERAGGAAPAGPDTSIVNPRHLPPALRSAVCEQCHLQGQERVVRRGRDVWEYRPGLPFGQFVSVFVRHPSLAQAHRSVGQFEQMEASKCYTASAGRLGCTSCHDPHAAPDAGAKAGFYRARCLTCHETKGCTAPEPDRRAKADSCVACHMPRAGSANIVHTSITDHRVPRRPGPPAPPAGVADRDPLPVVPFRAGPPAPPAAERDRDYGIALGRFAAGQPGSPIGRRAGGAAVDRLLGALRRAPDDAPAWLGMAFARDALGDPGGWAEGARAAAGADPDGELALAELAAAEAAVGRLDAAEAAAARLIELNPTAVDSRLTRVTVLLRKRDWAGAEAECRAALRVHPLHPRARMYLAVCLHHRGDVEGGRREVETAARLATAPGQADAMRQMYRRETR